MGGNVDFFFDCSSPWTWLGFEKLVRAAAEDGFEINWRPFLVGAVFNAVNKSVYAMRADPQSARSRYLAKDLQDWARDEGLHIKMPPSVFPVNSARAMRALLVAADAGRCEPAARRLFQLYWSEDRDISQPEVISVALAEAGMDPSATLAEADGEVRRAQLRANGEALIAAGGFGTPSFLLGDDLYFGQDRLELVRAAVRSRLR